MPYPQANPYAARIPGHAPGYPPAMSQPSLIPPAWR